jgi:hypothetical protein
MEILASPCHICIETHWNQATSCSVDLKKVSCAYLSNGKSLKVNLKQEFFNSTIAKHSRANTASQVAFLF